MASLVCVLVASGLSYAMTTGVARAQGAPQQGFRLDRYATPPTSHDGLSLTFPGALAHLQSNAQVNTHYARSPLVVRNQRDQPVLAHRVGLELTAALGLYRHFEIYARLPAVVVSRGQGAQFELTTLSAPTGSALSDMALGVTASLSVSDALKLGARAEAILPTGSVSSLASDGQAEPSGELLAGWQRGRIMLAAGLGATLRPQRAYASAHLGPELHWGAALRLQLQSAVEALVEAAGTRGLTGRDAKGAADGLELLMGARKRIETPNLELSFSGAVAAGLTQLIGEPAFRALLSAGLTPLDHAQQSAGVPGPLDRDGDGIADVADLCADEPEDVDGTKDGDGCVDADDDGDGVADISDACPQQAGQGRNGCITDDLDDDGVPDKSDLCARDPEDRDGDRDEDGCPDLDSDGDGLTDDRDSCPDVKGVTERQGCLLHAKLEGDRIQILSPITFDTQEVAIEAASARVIDDVAALLLARSQLMAVLVVRMGRRGGLDGGLVTARARVSLLIEALVARGVPRSHLSSQIELDAPGARDRIEILVRALPP